MLNKKQAEEKAVSHIKDVLSQPGGCIDPSCITTNDKTPSWDGDVLVYKDNNWKKSHIVGKVSTQIKGIQVNLPQEVKMAITKSVSIVDLKNYYNDGGAIYFVVHIDKNNADSKVAYYKALTPVLLKQYLNEKQDGNISIEMELLPTASDMLTSVFLEFIDNCKKQAAIENVGIINDLSQVDEITTFVQSYGSTPSLYSLLQSLNKNDRVWYGKLRGTNILAPLDNQFRFPVNLANNYPVTVDHKNYYDSTMVSNNNGRISIQLGESTSIDMNTDGSNCKVNFKCAKYARQRLHDLMFLQAAAKAKKLNIGDLEIDFSLDKDSLEAITLYDSEINRCRHIVTFLDKLNIVKDFDMESLTDKTTKTLAFMIEQLSEWIPNKKKGDTDVEPKIGICRIPIGNLNLILFQKRADKDVSVLNLLSSNICCVFVSKDEKQQLVAPTYHLLTKDDYAKCDNIDYNDAVESFINMPGNNNFGLSMEQINLELLKMIHAYDVNNNKTLLLAARKLALWLKTEDQEAAIEIKRIRALNLLQIEKRMRDLTPDEEDILYDITQDKKTECAIAANLLLGNMGAVKFLFKKLPLEEQENIRQWPIYKFWIE